MVTFGHFEPEFLDEITREIRTAYGLSTVIQESYVDLTEHYNPSRRQYDANNLLNILRAIPVNGAIKTVGIFRVDLFIPVLTYIFGQAVLSGPIAIASLYRLRNELYGLEKNNDLLLDRFIKVIVHELGHSFGLVHCHNPGCVMRSSTYVEDIDQKGRGLCYRCHRLLDLQPESEVL
ncbi:MAG: archaemetzincin family Zn-dependent metalloprotease [Bacteroidales bacterium]